MAPLCYAAKFDPFLSLDCAPTPSTLAQSKERKGSNFAIWQHVCTDNPHQKTINRDTEGTRPLKEEYRRELVGLLRRGLIEDLDPQLLMETEKRG